MKTRLIGIVFSIIFLTACGRKIDNTIADQELEQTEPAVKEDEAIEEKNPLEDFMQGNVKAYRTEDEVGFYIQDLNLAKDGDDWDYFNYSVGEMADIDNDGEDELIINGPYGGMYLDCVDDKVVIFAEGGGTASNLSYVYYDDAYWIVYSDTTHTGRIMYMLTKYNGSNTVVDSFKLCAEFYDTEYENGDFYYRDETITMEEFEELRVDIFGSEDSTEFPIAYVEILEHCKNIIDKVKVEHTGEKEHSEYYPEQEGNLAGFAEFVLHSGINKEDFCYSYTDLNDDGKMELILTARCSSENGGTINYKAGYTLINIFTLDGDEAVTLVDAYFHCNWFINADMELINERRVNPAWYEIGVYSLEKDGTTLEEKYCLYNKYLENNKDVGQYERLNGGEEVLTDQYEDFNSEDLWEKYMGVLNQYTENLYELDLVSIYEK